MLQKIEDWALALENKPRTFWVRLCLLLVSVLSILLVIVRYLNMKDSVLKTLTEGKLVEDDKKDVEYKAAQGELKNQVAEEKKEAEDIRAEVTKVEKNLVKKNKEAKNDQELINDIKSWEDFDEIVK